MQIKKLRPSSKGGEPEYVKCMIYGQNGIGKTALIRTLVHHGYKPLILDTNKGLKTLKSYIDRTGIELDYVDITNQVDEATGLVDTWAWEVLRETFREIKGEIRNKSFQYDVLVIDDYTELSRCLKEYVSRENPDTHGTTQQQYGIIRDHTILFSRAIRDLPCHVYAIAGRWEGTDDNDKQIYRPNVEGSFRNELVGMFDEAYYMYMRVTEEKPKGGVGKAIKHENRILVTNPTRVNGVDIQSKNRGGKLQLEEEADLGRLFNINSGKGDSKNNSQLPEPKTEKKEAPKPTPKSKNGKKPLPDGKPKPKAEAKK